MSAGRPMQQMMPLLLKTEQICRLGCPANRALWIWLEWSRLCTLLCWGSVPSAWSAVLRGAKDITARGWTTNQQFILPVLFCSSWTQIPDESLLTAHQQLLSDNTCSSPHVYADTQIYLTVLYPEAWHIIIKTKNVLTAKTNGYIN